MSAARKLSDCKTDAEVDAWYEAEAALAQNRLKAAPPRLVHPVADFPFDDPDESLDAERQARQSRFTASELWDMDFPPVAGQHGRDLAAPS
ncbi:hypothetical protein [Brevundimonas sp. TWP2-3-4b1]|uniref:hypothetical protein n=1 Tax=Brevundimonas sp. TWP2-3-4b1 TaxID=2804580 RepID=UPI003CEDD6D8